MKDYIVTDSTKEDIDFIDKKLDEYNEARVPYTQGQWAIDISKTLKDAQGNFIATMKAYLYGWNCLYIELFFVREEYRKKGYGTLLLREVERAAKEKGSYLAHVDTFDFQALDFYIKNGYSIFGVLENCPPGHKRYYLKKDLS